MSGEKPLHKNHLAIAHYGGNLAPILGITIGLFESDMRKTLLAGLFSLFLFGCATPSEELIPQANQVRVLTTSLPSLDQCNWVGEVTGNEGHWYSYLFYSNDALIQGAVNELKNNAFRMGADTVVTMSPHNFTTSVSLLGTAYDCR